LKIGEGTQIFEPVTIVHKEEISIGKNCSIGQFCFIGCKDLTIMDEVEICPQVTISGHGKVTIGRGATICYGARIIPSTMDKKFTYMNDLVRHKSPNLSDVISGSITIGEGAYIGSNAVICISEKHPNISIGDFAIVGALSYLDKSVLPHAVFHPNNNNTTDDRDQWWG